MEKLDAIVRAREIKKALDLRVKGKLMIKQDGKYYGNQARGIWDFNVMFDLPTPANKTAIENTLKHFGAKYGAVRAVGGVYGMRIHFTLGEQ